MPLPAPTLRKLYLLAICTLLGGVIGIVYSMIVGGQPKIAFFIGCAVLGGVMTFELLYVHRPAGAWLRSLPLPLFLGISTLVWTLIIAVGLQIVPRFFGIEQAYGGEYQATTFQQDLVVTLVIAFAFNTLLRIRRLIGGRVLKNFLLGRYHRPLREERVFLFLDLADSTRLSEELGDIQVQSLIGQFFFDIAQPITDRGGETHRYIGDEVVVTWPYSIAIRDADCLQCVFDIQNLIDEKSSFYQAEFGVVPAFRAGMHGGPVVSSEIGDDKREIVYFGDTINTAARIQSLCKEMKRDFLISGDLLESVQLSENIQTELMGDVALRGKSQSMEVYALSQST